MSFSKLMAVPAGAVRKAAHTHQVAKQQPQPDPEWWLDTAADGNRRLWDTIDRACPAQGFLSNEKCVDAKVIESFAKQNDAAQHCVEEARHCVLTTDATDLARCGSGLIHIDMCRTARRDVA